MSDGIQLVREACERWGFPFDGGERVGSQAVDAIRRADDELDVLFPEQRERLQQIIDRQNSGGAIDPKDGAFVFGLTMQAMFAVTRDARNAGAVT